MKSLHRDALLLFALQMGRFALPLATLPWLTHTLGPNGFGKFSYVLAIAGYFTVLADYGFALTAAQSVSIWRDDMLRRSQIFWQTVIAKCSLVAAGLALLTTLVGFFEPLREDSGLLYIAYIGVLGTALTPVWYYQGLERLPKVTAISIGMGLLSLPPILLLVRSPADVWVALLIQSTTNLLTALVCTWGLVREGSLKIVGVARSDVIKTLREGWLVFVSTGGFSLYSNTNTVVVGLIGGHAAAGYFAAADKLVRAAQAVLAPVSQVVFPRVSHHMHHQPEQAFRLIRKVLALQGMLTLLISGAIFISAGPLVMLLFGPSFGPAMSPLRWMAAVPFLVGLSNVFGIQTMLPLGMKRTFAAILVAAGALNLSLLLLLTHYFAQDGGAISVLVTEAFVTGCMFLVLWSRGIPIFGRVRPQQPHG